MFLEPEKLQIKTSEISDEFEFDEMNLFHLDIDRHRWESTGSLSPLQSHVSVCAGRVLESVTFKSIFHSVTH